MKVVNVELESISPYSQSQAFRTEKPGEETHADFEKRIWRERIHATADGHVFIPPMSFKNCISSAAKFLSIKIPGKRGKTFTAIFESGIIVMEPLILPVMASDVDGEWLFVPSDGKRGGGSRVWKCFPVIPTWSGTITIHVLNALITKKVLEEHLEAAGMFIGIGRFRPEKNGFYGRYKATNISE